MARVIAVECERSVCAVVLLCCVGVLGHAAALGTGVEGLGTRNFRVFLLIPIYYYIYSNSHKSCEQLINRGRRRYGLRQPLLACHVDEVHMNRTNMM